MQRVGAVMMEETALLVKAVREALAITQEEMAKAIGLSQSAITKYETRAGSISFEAVLKMAPLLNLNEQYLDYRIGNPFKQSDPKIVIKMLVANQKGGGAPDYSLIDLVTNSNKRLDFVFLAPPPRAMNWRLRTPGDFYALLVKDAQGNTFLFRRKKERRPLGNLGWWLLHLEALRSMGKSTTYRIERLPLDLFNRIREWTEIPSKQLKPLFKDRDDVVGERITALQRVLEILSESGWHVEKTKLRTLIEDTGSAEVDLTQRLVEQIMKMVRKPKKGPGNKQT